ncbi:hypothetical protein Cgig2_007665 [Carnegiea gigantea]|uniref:Uncharacterized protein n=1 Tax=Carnegiea gigantea TaxID=171969 RepID=A0A9Q1K438_9CARY|nr:hypothetical protein Cgig2_007665 [Carnegiea gigantea]
MYLFLFFKDMLFLLGLIFSCFLLAGKCTSSSLLDNLQPPQQPPQQPPLAPALYVFGDSLFDSGNNNWLPTLAKANYPPYGLNFPKGPTGRFTNGETVADFIADYLGLPYPPPHVSLSRPNSVTGYNYASGSCGILPLTGSQLGVCLNLEEQIKLFEKTVKTKLTSEFKEQKEVSQHLSKSIFIFSVGNNDYISTYFGLFSGSMSKRYNPQQFAQLLVDKLSQQLQKLYKLGARKIVVFELGPIGCIPSIAMRHVKEGEKCDEEKNEIVSIFNEQLALMLNNLTSTLQGSHFILGHANWLGYDAIINPSKYGLSDSRSPCCITWGNGTLSCIPELKPCPNPNARYFWDGYHPTQATCSVIATHCINGSGVCLPLNIHQLVHAINYSPCISLVVFGDSLVDNGNNNWLPTVARANYSPHGLHFPGGIAGRFTNGRTIADFIGEYLGLPYPPPYASLLGPNWAGLPDPTQDVNLFRASLITGMFEMTVNSALASKFKDPTELSNHLSKAIFVLVVGNNDYLNNYLDPLYLATKHYDPPQFAQFLVRALSQKLQRLYQIGARKVMVSELGPLGCIPSIKRRLSQQKHRKKCDEDANRVISIFNKHLAFMLKNLTSTLQGSHFILGRSYWLSCSALMNPTKYGLSDSGNPCCETWLNGTPLCIPEQKACPNPSRHYFFDGYHPTEAIFSLLAAHCINGSSVCLPLNLKRLVQL